MIVRWLNEAQRKLCWEGGILVSAWTASTVAGQEEYSVPSDFVRVRSVTLDQGTSGSQLKLAPIRVEQRDPRKTQGTPLYYFIWGLNVSGNNQPTIGLNPIPSTSGSSDLVLRAHQIPADMVSGGQAPEVMYQWQDALSCYGAMRWYERMKDWTGKRDCQAEWEDWVRQARSFKNPMGVDTPTSISDTAGYAYNLQA